MDGENKGKLYEQMDDLGGFPYFWKIPTCLELPINTGKPVEIVKVVNFPFAPDVFLSDVQV